MDADGTASARADHLPSPHPHTRAAPVKTASHRALTGALSGSAWPGTNWAVRSSSRATCCRPRHAKVGRSLPDIPTLNPPSGLVTSAGHHSITHLDTPVLTRF